MDIWILLQQSLVYYGLIRPYLLGGKVISLVPFKMKSLLNTRKSDAVHQNCRKAKLRLLHKKRTLLFKNKK